MALSPSETLRPKQGVGEIDQKADGHDRGQCIVKAHVRSPSQPFARVGVAKRQRKEPQPDGQHDDVQHWIAPVQARRRLPTALGSAGESWRNSPWA